MSVTANTSADGKLRTISVMGSFQFEQHREFREGYLAFTQTGGEILVSLAGTTYMDSSALGMLKILLDHCKKFDQQVVLASAPPAIRRILEIASFDKIFRMQ